MAEIRSYLMQEILIVHRTNMIHKTKKYNSAELCSWKKGTNLELWLLGNAVGLRPGLMKTFVWMWEPSRDFKKEARSWKRVRYHRGKFGQGEGEPMDQSKSEPLMQILDWLVTNWSCSSPIPSPRFIDDVFFLWQHAKEVKTFWSAEVYA